ncbi:MAG: NAD-dependent epimerase/dehydratase family protein [Gemmataceae bacterium]|nr:NAD-dependent epimerase/dehydratase family protein [Gemmataceae bacterium]
MDKLNVITGATGQLGSHIAEQLRTAGERVRALVRPGSDASFLRNIGIDLAEGDLRDAASVRRACTGATIVYNCAAKVSDWGKWSDFRDEAVATTRNLVDACRAESVARLLHVSSISVYGHPKLAPGQLVTETTPLGQEFWMWDYYPRAKLLAEEIVWEYKPNVTIVRPSWIYGPRDRVTIPRIVPALQEKRVPIIGSGDNLLNIIYVGDVAAGVIAAANHPNSVGQAYNLCSQGEITQRQMVDTLTDALGLPRIQKRVPYGLALRFAFLKEFFAKLFFRKKPPTITRRAIYLIGRPTLFSIDKAKSELGWSPRVKIDEGVRRTLDWYFDRK